MAKTHKMLFVLICLFIACGCSSGDYSYSVGQYEYVRCNAMETLICDSEGTVVFSPLNHQRTGPVFRLSYTPTHLVLNTYSREFTNDDGLLAKIDRNDDKLFLVNRTSDVVTGPHSQREVEIITRVDFDSLSWKTTIYPILPQLIVIGLIPILAIAGMIWLIPKLRSTGRKIGDAPTKM